MSDTMSDTMSHATGDSGRQSEHLAEISLRRARLARRAALEAVAASQRLRAPLRQALLRAEQGCGVVSRAMSERALPFKIEQALKEQIAALSDEMRAAFKRQLRLARAAMRGVAHGRRAALRSGLV